MDLTWSVCSTSNNVMCTTVMHSSTFTLCVAAQFLTVCLLSSTCLTNCQTIKLHIILCKCNNQSETYCERERESSNSKTLFYKDCSLASVKNLSNNRVRERERGRGKERERSTPINNKDKFTMTNDNQREKCGFRTEVL